MYVYIYTYVYIYIGWAENAPQPITTVPEGTLDFRTNRLTPGHADLRSATTKHILTYNILQ